MKVLVTGAEGFVGTHLLPHLRERGHSVIATSHDGSIGEKLLLPDDEGCRELVARVEPDAVVHLAAVSEVGAAEDEPEHAYTVNTWGTRALLQAIAERDRPCRFLFVSTSAIYGPVPEDRQPVTERETPRPVHVYAMTKLAAESVLHAFPYRDASRLRWNIMRPFNHTGPGQRSEFVMSSFARQVAELERGGPGGGVIRVGNLKVRRDFLDVRDVVAAYVMVLESDCDRRIFNVSRGESLCLEDMVGILRDRARVPVRFEVDPDRLRSGDIESLAGDASQLTEATGWKPRIPIDQTLTDLLEYWREDLGDHSEGNT